MARVRATRNMVRVLVYNDARERNTGVLDSLVSTVTRDVTVVSNSVPRLFFLTPDQDVIGYVDYEQVAEASDEGNKVAQIMQWANAVPRQVSRADAMAARGRYAQAMDEIDEVVDQDRQISHLTQVLVGKASEDDDIPETPVRPMFESLRDEKKAEYEALAQEKLDAAQRMVEREELREAQRALRTLISGPEDFSTTAPAQALYEEVIAKLRANR